jgi:phytoene dehydrogenase-like protein
MSSTTPSIVIIGAGLSGLAAACRLHKAGRSFVVIEASDGVGGRVRSDKVDGFTLDRGFQVLLPGYPELRRMVDLEQLDLRPFYRGSLVHWAGSTHRLADPLYHPKDCFNHLWDKIAPWKDKWYTLLLRKHVLGMKSIPRRHRRMSTAEFFRDWGFSDIFLNRFLRPFFGGVFLDRELSTDSRLFEFVFAMFDRSGTAVPAADVDRAYRRSLAAIRQHYEQPTASTPGSSTPQHSET